MKKTRGFTLIELVVVMAIIAVLAVLIIGAIVVARNTAQETKHRGNARSVQTGLESYYSKNKSYPATSGTVSFTAAAGSGGVTLSTTSECTTATQLGGGTVTYSTTGYTITPYNATCGAALGASDTITIP